MKKLLIITQKVDPDDQLLGFFVDWIEEFKKHFESVEVVALRSPDKNWWRFFWQILRSIPQNDAVFVHMAPMFVILAGPWARLWGRRLGFWYTHGAVTTKLRLAEKLANIIFTASAESFRLPSKKVIITGHGIDIGLFKPNYELRITNDETLRVLSVGRIAPVKNYEVLIEAAKILKQKNVDFSITIVGQAALGEDKIYAEKIKQASAGLPITFAGKINNHDLPAVYQKHDLFVHMSQTGSVDKVLLEALACGLRVVSCNESSLAFLPKELIFQPNDPSELAEKILSSAKIAFDGRTYVMQNHELKRLIGLLSKNL